MVGDPDVEGLRGNSRWASDWATHGSVPISPTASRACTDTPSLPIAHAPAPARNSRRPPRKQHASSVTAPDAVGDNGCNRGCGCGRARGRGRGCGCGRPCKDARLATATEPQHESASTGMGIDNEDEASTNGEHQAAPTSTNSCAQPQVVVMVEPTPEHTQALHTGDEAPLAPAEDVGEALFSQSWALPTHQHP